MTLFYPADNLLILDYNRVLKTLNGYSSAQFMEALEENFTITPLEDGKSSTVEKKHTFSMFLDHKWFTLELKHDKLDLSTPVSQLDSQILTDTVLAPILGIEDLKKDSRIDFVGGIRGHEELEKRCLSDCAAAFALHPVNIEELLSVADAGLIMPPKSTWFEPKPRSGFCVRVFD